MTLWKHMRGLWPRWTLMPVAPFVLWTLFWIARGQVRWDHLAVCGIAAVMAYWNKTSKRLYFGVLPLGLVGLLYDAMRFVKNVGLSQDTVHVCDLRAIELRLFGIDVGGIRQTLHDVAQAHAVRALDVFFAIPYGVFLYAVFGFEVYLFLRNYTAALRFTWGFLILNILGFATYHVYPAAPPWYFHKYGCVVDLAAHASPGANLLRVDHMMGLAYFTGFYGRSSDVFGAVPSLHVAYPLLMIIEGRAGQRWPMRLALITFYVWMCTAAVYLDHHWVVDIVLGSIYTIVVAWLMRMVPQLRPTPEFRAP
jgi:inositol phosphorylceramide synthase catalytic subunit